MKKKALNYNLRITLITIFVAIAAVILFNTVLKKYYFPAFWILLAFFYMVHIIAHVFLVRAEKNKKIKFNSAYLISFSIKFISYLLLLIIYLILNKGITYPFAITFFGLYIVYTVSEIRSSIIFSKSSEKIFEKSD